MDPQIFLNTAKEVEYIEKFYSEKIFLVVDEEFTSFEKKSDRFRAGFHEYLISVGEYNASELARMEALDWEAQNVDPLLMIHSVTIDSALVSLWVFFENKLKKLLIKYYFYAPCTPVDEKGRPMDRDVFCQKVNRLKFEGVLYYFSEMFKLNLTDEVSHTLREFNLLINSIKHGDGPSFNAIKDEFPDRVEDSARFLPESEFLVRKREDVGLLAGAIKDVFKSAAATAPHATPDGRR